MRVKNRSEHGFTLIEVSIVLLILGILTRTAIAPLKTVQTIRLRHNTSSDLALIKQSLIAHVVATGTVPCPLVNDSDFASSANLSCQTASGAVPAAKLGIAGSIDDRGALLDAWNRPYHLAVSLVNHSERGDTNQPDWTSIGEASRLGIRHLSADITVCQRSNGNNCDGNDIRSEQVVFAVWSAGQDASGKGQQLENMDGDRFFIDQDYSQQLDQPFDDQIVWATAADVIYWQLKAGWLP